MGDDFLGRHVPENRFEVGASVLAAREAIAAAGASFARIPDAALERPWPWRDHEADVRYGLFRAIEAVEAATAGVSGALAGAGLGRGPAALRIAPSTTARWALHGRLLGLDDGWLDRVPREGEWTLRETLAHIVSSQRGYTVYTTFHWHRNRREPVGEDELKALEAEVVLPEEADEGSGTLAEIRARLDETTDASARLAAWGAADLARPARWSGIPVDIGFRLGRTSSHLMEHPIQVDKGLAWLDHRPTDAQRIAGDLYSAWGRLEALVFPMEPAWLSRSADASPSADEVLGGLSAELRDLAISVPAAAAAG